MLFELSPEPSDLKVYVKPVPFTGGASNILSEPLIDEGTISKFLELPPMLAEKLKIGKSF